MIELVPSIITGVLIGLGITYAVLNTREDSNRADLAYQEARAVNSIIADHVEDQFDESTDSL